MSEKKTRARDGGPFIIGTGLPRTGTTSLCEALETLGFAPCHHFRGMTHDDPFPYRDARLWSKAAKMEDKDARQNLLHYLLTKGKFKAAVDYPTSCFIDDIVEMYPHAKFIHGERSSPSIWRTSFNETVGRLNQDNILYYATYLIPFIRFAIVPLINAMDERNRRILNARIYCFDSQLELYRRHNARVREVVPQDRLLEFDPREGYESLCDFLEIPVPTDERGIKLDFPHANDREDMQRSFKFATATGCVIWCVVITGTWFAVRKIALFP